jgi:uncharacterized protein with GYD domain
VRFDEGRSAMRFVMLLNLTSKGSQHVEDAGASLRQAAEDIIKEAGGEVAAWSMTMGRFDAYIDGTCPDASLTGFVAWFAEQGYFKTETLIGRENQVTFAPMQHR